MVPVTHTGMIKSLLSQDVRCERSEHFQLSSSFPKKRVSLMEQVADTRGHSPADALLSLPAFLNRRNPHLVFSS